MTTGGSVKEVINVVEGIGGKVAGVGVLIDRSKGNVDFGYPFKSLLSVDIKSYEVDECPLCKEGIPMVKPGSRSMK